MNTGVRTANRQKETITPTAGFRYFINPPLDEMTLLAGFLYYKRSSMSIRL
jgi:hypothetical protein